jgi:hypothetical protein
VRQLVLALSMVALAGAGCGGSSSPEPCVRSEENGCLVVIQRTTGDRPYVEGSISYVHVTDSFGTVFEAELHPRFSNRQTLEASLDPGSYRLTSYQRPCSGNCGTLDPATDRCSTDFEMKSGSQARVLIALRPSEGCSATAEF